MAALKNAKLLYEKGDKLLAGCFILLAAQIISRKAFRLSGIL